MYWRRRVVALFAGLLIIMMVAWALDSAMGGSAPSPAPAATTSGTAGASAGSAASGPAAATGPAPAGGHHVLRSCPAGSVVLSLFSSEATYTIRQTPQFEVDVVSTAAGTCTFDIGAKSLLVQISAAGKQVWSSSDCAEGQASLVTRLRRGVPTIVPITWDGQHSSPGCPVPGTPAVAGTYSATASAGSMVSNQLTFRIG